MMEIATPTIIPPNPWELLQCSLWQAEAWFLYESSEMTSSNNSVNGCKRPAHTHTHTHAEPVLEQDCQYEITCEIRRHRSHTEISTTCAKRSSKSTDKVTKLYPELNVHNLMMKSFCPKSGDHSKFEIVPAEFPSLTLNLCFQDLLRGKFSGLAYPRISKVSRSSLGCVAALAAIDISSSESYVSAGWAEDWLVL